MKRVYPLLGLLFAGAAAQSCRHTVQAPVDSTPTGLVSVRPWTPPKQAFAVVVRNEEGPCDVELVTRAVGNYRVERLSRSPDKLPSALARYCVVRKDASTPTQSAGDLAFTETERKGIEQRMPSGYETGADYRVVMAHASPLRDLPPLELLQTFAERAGDADPGSVSWPDELAGTRIAVVDTVAGAGGDWPLPVLGSDGHGGPLARMMQQLLCSGTNPQGACLGTVVGYAALTNTLSTGQQVGMLNQLAAQITQAVVDAGDDHLVVNLSVGWVPVEALGGDDFEDMPVATKMVYDALRFAACQGAVVFAAAGNDLGAPAGAFDTDAVYPAAWMKKRSFSCTDLGLEGEFEGTVVHAVGGVDADGHRIALTRQGSFPNLVAYGVKGVASKELADPPDIAKVTAPLSGTSVATAVVSAAAAARWTLEPGKSAEDLVEAMKNDASAIAETTADFTYGGSTAVSRMKVCEQVAAGCIANPSACTDLTYPCRSETTPGPSAATLSSIRSALGVKTAPKLTAKSCPDGTTVWGVAGKTSCMDALTASIDEGPWVYTQPGEEPCVECTLEVFAGAGRFYGVLDAAKFPGGEAWLEVSGGAPKVFVDLGGIVKDLGIDGPFGSAGVVIEGLPKPSAGVGRVRIIVGVGDVPATESTAGEVQVLP